MILYELYEYETREGTSVRVDYVHYAPVAAAVAAVVAAVAAVR